MAGQPVVGPNNVGESTNLQPPIQIAGVDANGAIRRIQLDTGGWQHVELVDASGNAVTLAADPSKADEATFTIGTGLVTPIGGTYNDAAAALTAGQVGIPRLTSDRKQIVTDPATAGGSLTPFHLEAANSTNATVVKASAGSLYGWYITNNNAATRFLAFHNTTSTPTAGANIFWKIGIPANGAANVMSKHGITFGTGIAITTVTGAADSNSTAVAADDLTINLFYV